MKGSILGLHHVTATVAEAQPDLDFCVGALGMRLVKKTVNFDNHSVYHFYYGDERGTPGTIWTTFPYAGMGVPRGVIGEGQITATSFSVPAGSLDWWAQRLRERRVESAVIEDRFGEPGLAVDDPSGLRFELLSSPRDEREPWAAGGIDPAAAIRGLHSVTMTIARPDATVALMTGLLGFEVVAEEPGRVRLAAGGSGPGHTIDLAHGTGAGPARNGLGTVHHVAFAAPSGEVQRSIREALLGQGGQVTEVLDRQYFQSIYFREPGGVLFEVATTSPGFTVDEALGSLGRELKLPPWEEPNRARIEASLPQISPVSP
ncbi:MAG TPA: ring-cleaving dioxygenase [Gemmatimonadales bacterium]|nr:ring-cleaving dioxygenase [Gemmatimonadales bacterium]